MENYINFFSGRGCCFSPLISVPVLFGTLHRQCITHTGVLLLSFIFFTHTHTHTHHYIMIIRIDNDRILDVCGTGSLLTTGLFNSDQLAA